MRIPGWNARFCTPCVHLALIFDSDMTNVGVTLREGCSLLELQQRRGGVAESVIYSESPPLSARQIR